MKSLKTLTLKVIQDMGDLLEVAVDRDIVTIEGRYQHEGDSFLTITLPQFADGLLQSVSEERCVPASFPSFGCKGRLPRFLGGFTERIFAGDGTLLRDADAECLRAVLQICNLWRKLERPVSPGRLKKAKLAFIATDAEVGNHVLPDISDVRRTFSLLFRDILVELDSRIANFQLVPRHGPGAVAERLSRREKREAMTWLESTEGCFPRHLYGTYDFTQPPPVVPLELEPPSRVAFVPKTMKGPRVIAMEPANRQYLQQALSRPLYRLLADKYPGSIDLYDQRTNQAWAWWGSGTGEIATLDLSEASDRLSWALVKGLIPDGLPHLTDAIESLRSTHCELDGSVYALNKFASMGSALTFPIQSMVFLAIAVTETRRSGRNPLQGVAVYGDDIIVPTAVATKVMESLEALGLKVNSRKSYTTGSYRESCGEEYFRSHDVKVVKIKRYPSSGTLDPQTSVSLLEYRNKFYVRGMWRCVRYLDTLLGSRFRFTSPVGHPSLGRWSVLPPLRQRVSPTLFRDEIQVPVARPVGRVANADGRGAILEFFFRKEEDPREAVSPYDALERSPALAIHRSWTPL